MKYKLAAVWCALSFISAAIAQPAPGERKPGNEISLDVLIADLTEPLENPSATQIFELDKAGKLAASTRLRISTLDDNPAHFQSGGRPATKTVYPLGTAGGGARGVFNSRIMVGGTVSGPVTSQQSTSIQLQATTRAEDDGSVLMQIYVERPETAVPRQLATADGGDESRRTFAFVCQSTLRVESGVPKVLGARQSAAGNERSQTWILVTATAEAPSK
jgi:hypothetical protein